PVRVCPDGRHGGPPVRGAGPRVGVAAAVAGGPGRARAGGGRLPPGTRPPRLPGGGGGSPPARPRAAPACGGRAAGRPPPPPPPARRTDRGCDPHPPAQTGRLTRPAAHRYGTALLPGALRSHPPCTPPRIGHAGGEPTERGPMNPSEPINGW